MSGPAHQLPAASDALYLPKERILYGTYFIYIYRLSYMDSKVFCKELKFLS